LWSLLFLLLAVEGPAPQSAAQEAVMLGHEAELSAKAGNFENALVQYQMAYERVPSPDYLFNMAQCEFQLDRLGDALAHYQKYLQAADTGEDGRDTRRAASVDLARKRIETINRREFVVGINTSPAGARVRIDGPRQLAGFAPNNFRLPRGHYTITISRQDYATQTQVLDVETSSPPPLYFSLRPIPGRLSIRTKPPNATLYVRGNRTQNPYDQAVEPGKYEIYAEATDYQPRRTEVEVEAGQRQPVNFELDYLQRSGRPELIWFWTTAGAVAGGTFVLARLNNVPNTTASGSLVAAGAIFGGIAGAFSSTLSKTLAPDYIRDNRAMFRITSSVIGAVEGASVGLAAGGSMAGWAGGMAGLGAGTVAGVWLDDRAPNYGRVTAIQSAAALGLLAGALAVPALKPTMADDGWTGHYRPLGVLVGVNLGLAAGLAIAYLPDQHRYGPSWQRVIFIDLAAAAGAFLGAVTTTIDCLAGPENTGPNACRFASRQQTMRLTMAGGLVGLGVGWFLTRNFDKVDESAERRGLTFLPTPTMLATPTPEGSVRVVPGLAAQGRF
jgi:hypothetical protein